MSSSHLTNGKIVEFAPNGPQTESSEPNEQFIAMLVYEPRNSEQYNDFALELRNFDIRSCLYNNSIKFQRLFWIKLQQCICMHFVPLSNSRTYN